MNDRSLPVGISLLFIGVAMLTGSCAGNAVPAVYSSPLVLQEPQSDTAAALREVQALEVPADVDAELFAVLRTELLRSIVDPGPDERSVANSGGTQGFEPDGIPIGVDHGQWILSWQYRMDGDYDQNGEVNAADLTPLAQNFGARPESEDGAGKWKAWDALRVIDGNLDGELNIADVTVIGRSFGRRFMHYEIFATDDISQYPFENGETGFEPFRLTSLADAYGRGQQEPFYFHEVLQPDERHSYYWVRFIGDTVDNFPTRIALNRDIRSGKEFYNLPYRQQATQLSYDPTGNSVNFRMVYHGDGDRNGEINLSDLTSIGTFLGKTDWPFISDRGAYSEYHDPDMNRDGTVDLCDIITVGFNYAAQISGYQLYHSPASGVGRPPTYWHGQSQEPLHVFVYSKETLRSEDTTFELPFTPESGSSLWLRPYNDEGYGAVCGFVEVP